MIRVTEKDVENVIDLTKRLKDIRYIPSKKNLFNNTVPTLPETTKWLLAFCCWHCLFNSKYHEINPDRLIGVVSTASISTFNDFIMYLRRHEGVRITPSRELPSLRFLANCSEDTIGFYRSLMTKKWIDDIPVVDAQNLLDIEGITKEKVYGELEYLKTPFSGLKYPLTMRVAPPVKMEPFILVKEASYTSMFERDKDGGYKAAKKPEWVEHEVKVARSPRFALAGFTDGETLFPTDYFRSWEEVLAVLKGEELSYHVRYNGLRQHIDNNLLIRTEGNLSAYVASKEFFVDTLMWLLKEERTIGDLLLTDSTSTATGSSHRIRCDLARGTIEDILVEDEKPVGFRVWLNGALVDCIYRFNAKEQGVLSAKEAAIGKVILMRIVRLDEPLFIGTEIMWQEQRWKPYRLNTTGAFIEKCIMCGDIKSPHYYKGMCLSCQRNLSYYLKRYGVGVWINPSKQVTKKREANAWDCSLLNSVKFRYQGLPVVAGKDGRWKFKSKLE